ncbi:MAG TPA: glycosyltransferase family 39 protein, partial [Desulfobacterales bacterium]|nr:glycosyltransferase family 39 protein [Desulfobacterales bacterium]
MDLSGRVLPVRRVQVLVVILALGVRLAAVLYAGGYHQPWLSEYEIIAKSLVEQGYFGFDFYGRLPNRPSSFMPPFYPFLLAGMMILFPANALLITRLLQAMVSAGSCLLVYKIGKGMFDKEEVGLLAALVAAVYPPFIGGTVEINTVTFDVLFLALAVYLLLRGGEKQTRDALWAGLSLGLAALTRATALAVLPVIFAWLWLRSKNATWHGVIKPFILVLLAAFLVILPWTIRNYLVHREFILISSNGGLNFWIGNNEKATGEYAFPSGTDPELFTRALSLSEAQMDRLYYQEAFGFIRDHSRQFLGLLVRKTLYFWLFRPNIGSNYPDAGNAVALAKALYVFSYILLLPLGALGIILSLGSWRKLFLIYG